MLVQEYKGTAPALKKKCPLGAVEAGEATPREMRKQVTQQNGNGRKEKPTSYGWPTQSHESQKARSF